MSLSPTRIIILSSEFPPGPGGIGDHAYNLSEQLIDNGYEVWVVTELRTGFSEKWKQVQPRAKMFYLRRHKLFPNLDLIIIFARLFFQQHDAIWVATGSRSLMMLGSAMAFFPRKSLVILHGHELLKGQWFKTWLLRYTIGNFSMAVSVSDFSKNNSKPHLDQNKIIVIPNGFNPEKYSSKPFLQQTVPSPQINIITVGRISARKGQQNVVRALPEIIKKFPSVVYHMIGINDNTDNMERLVANLGMKNHVRFHGVLSDNELEHIFKATEIFIMLSENQKDGDVEGFGIAIIEANYFGIPAIGSFGCGIEQAIKDGFSGRLVPAHEPEKIPAALEDILTDYERYSINAQSWAQEHVWTNVIKKYLNVISLVNQQRGVSGFFGTPQNYLHKNFGVLVRQKFVMELIGDVSEKNILDIGCGDGSVSLPFGQKNQLTLIDSSPNMITLAIANTPSAYKENVRYKTSSLEEAVTKEEEYDLIIAVGLLAHLDSWKDSLTSMTKALKKNGKMVIQISDASHWLIRHGLKPRGKRLYLLNSITSDTLIEGCKQNGLTLKTKKRYGLSLRGLGLLPNWFLYHFTLATSRHRILQYFSTEVIAVFQKD